MTVNIRMRGFRPAGGGTLVASPIASTSTTSTATATNSLKNAFALDKYSTCAKCQLCEVEPFKLLLTWISCQIARSSSVPQSPRSAVTFHDADGVPIKSVRCSRACGKSQYLRKHILRNLPPGCVACCQPLRLASMSFAYESHETAIGQW